MKRQKRAKAPARRQQARRLAMEPLEPRIVLSADSVVTFNEVMYNPAGVDESLEWIELRNQLSVDVELSNWSIEGGIDFQFDAGTIIDAGDYLVIAADAAALEAATGFSDAIGSYTGQLSNGGESVILRDHNLRLMDELDYGDDGAWPVAPDGSGVTLAKLTPHVATGSPASWTHSAEVDGTPGAVNFPTNGPTTSTLDLWSVDIQGIGSGGAFGQFDPPIDFSGVESNYGFGNVWNPFGVPAHDGASTTPISIDLVDSDGELSSLSFQISRVVEPGDDATDGVTGWGGSGGAGGLVDLTGDYLFVGAGIGNATSSVDWQITGLTEGSTYELYAYGGVSRNVSFTVDPISTTLLVPGSGARFPLITVGAGGTVTGSATSGSQVEGNWGGFQLREVEVVEPNDPSHPVLLFNEVQGAAESGFFLELHNPGNEAIDLTGLSITATGLAGGTYVIPNGSIASGGYLSLDEATLGFHPHDEDRLFLFNADNTSVLDAVRVKNSLRGRSSQHDNRWQRPDIATPDAANSFSFHDAIVINEILYHHYPIQPIDEVVETTTVVEFDNTWRYNQSGGNLGATWAQSIHAVDAVTWFSGNGLLGRESATLSEPIQTTLDLGPTTFYFETDFQYSGNLADVDELRLSHIIDDGAVFYVNGVEVWRHNMPGNVGDPVNAGTLASTTIGNAPLVGSIPISADQLIVGTNLLSVEVHQASGTSSDIVMGAELKLAEVTISGGPFGEDTEEWIELFNNSGQTVDLGGWKLNDAVSFTFDTGTTLAPGAYTVIARDAVALAAKYPNIAIAGEYSGKLSNSDERIELLDANKNIADEVHYYDGGRWSDLADAGGSSLELRDPDADNGVAESWAASDESAKSDWQIVNYSGVATTPGLGYNIWDEFVLGLLGAGEVLIDDVSVIRDPGGEAVELIQNGTFDTGMTHWRIGGNHKHSQIVPDPEDAGNNVLHLIATGTSEHILNHAETTLAGGESIQPGTEYEISYRAKWLKGSNQVNTRLYFNYLPNTTRLDVPRANGTPGAVNSQLQSNMGPTYGQFQHTPVTPDVSEAVTVSVAAVDDDGVASMTLYYSVNESAFATVGMTLQADGLFSVDIPGQSHGATVQFYVQAADELGAASTFPAKGADSRALYRVGVADAADTNSLQIIMLPSEANLLHEPTNTFSNDPVGATVVADGTTVYYDAAARLKGSSWGRNHDYAKGFYINFGADQKYRGIHESVTMNRDGKKEILAKHLDNSGGGMPAQYDDIIRFVSATGNYDGIAILSLARYNDVYLDSQFASGSDGNVTNLELLYTPTGTAGGGAEALKKSFPYTHTNGKPEFTNYGNDKELYRYNFQLKNNRDQDDYTGLIELAPLFAQSSSTIAQQAPSLIDVDQWARYFATMSLNGNDDTFNRLYEHNLRLFQRPEDGRFILIPWDLDRSFRISTSASLLGNGNLIKLFDDPANLRLFHGHADHLIQTTYNAFYLSPWATHYGSKTGENYSGVVSYVQNRANYVLSQLPALAPFAITTHGGNGFTTSESQVTIEGTGSYKIRSLKLNNNPTPLEVVWTGETIWQVTVPIGPGANLLDFQALDFFGNEIHSDSITVTSTATTPLADATNLRITELNYNPHDANPVPGLGEEAVDNDQFEFVELQNTHQIDIINLNGVQFSSTNGGASYTFGATTLGPGQRLVLARNQAALESRFPSGVAIAGVYAGKLKNSGDDITLLAADSTVIQQFSYDDNGNWPGRADGKGSSLEVIDTEGNYNSADNWRSSSEFGGSPGAAGTSPLFDVIVNEVLSHSDGVAPDLIELYNTTAAPIELSKWYLSDTSGDLFQFQVADGTSINPDQHLVFNETQLGFALDGQFGDDIWLVEADPTTGKPLRFADHHDFDATDTNVSLGRWPDGDPSGMLFPMTAQTFGSANSDPLFGDLLITEVYYNPAEVPSEEQANIAREELEFVELYNNRDNPVDIGHWSIEGIGFTLPVETTIGVGEAIVIVTFDPVLEPTKNTAFRNVFGVDGNTRLLGAASGQLNNAGETVKLLRPEDPLTLLTGNVLVDAVGYDDLAPWPTEANGNGKSLTRIAAADYAPLAASWTAEMPTPGSVAFVPTTPGDFDADGDVDGEDLDRWEDGFGTAIGANWDDGDADGDGDVDGNDFLNWQRNLTSIPESTRNFNTPGATIVSDQSLEAWWDSSGSHQPGPRAESARDQVMQEFALDVSDSQDRIRAYAQVAKARIIRRMGPQQQDATHDRQRDRVLALSFADYLAASDFTL